MTVLRWRHSVRALILTPQLELLLGRHEVIDGFVWAAPGGGIEPGETPHEALQRELVEEIGLELRFTEPPLVWHQEIVDNSICPQYDGVVNDYFLVKVDRFVPQGRWTSETLLKEGLNEFVWWSLDTMRKASPSQVFSPRNLVELFPSIGHGSNSLNPVLLST
ncbi:NUDIX domain-containing protein [Arthrobacter sp. TMN-49]